MCHFSRTSLYVDKGGIFISNETHKRSNRSNNGIVFRGVIILVPNIKF